MSEYFFSIEQVLKNDAGWAIKGLKPDANGYYRTPVAVLGSDKTTSGNVYDPKSFLNAIYNDRGIFYRTLIDGKLFGEWGHPKDLNISRNKTIYEKNISHHISKVFADRKTEDGNVLIEALIKPCGPYGEYFKPLLEDPFINSSLSLRAISRDQIQKGGHLKKFLVALITFDYVFAGGFEKASSRYAVSQESFVNIPLSECMASRPSADGIQVACEGIEDSELSKIIRDNTLEVSVLSEKVGRMSNGKLLDSTGRAASLTHKIFRR